MSKSYPRFFAGLILLAMFVFGAAVGGFSVDRFFNSFEFFAVFNKSEFSSIFKAALAVLLNFFFGCVILFYYPRPFDIFIFCFT